MATLVKSSLGNFLRHDGEDFVRDTRFAARFTSPTEAEAWITKTYGRNGHKFMFAAHVKDRDEVEGDDE